MKPIRILHIVSELNQGGIENFILNVYRQIDKSKIQFDFIVHHKLTGCFEDEIEKLGGIVYHFSLLDDFNVFKYKRELNTFFREHKEYKVVHGHLASIGFIYFNIARKNGVDIRIAHSHGISAPKNLKGLIKSLFFKFYSRYSTIRFACSIPAGKYLFGDKSFEVIPNGVDFRRFHYNKDKRRLLKEKYGLLDTFVIGHVGRFTVEKNHKFILQLFKKLLEDNQNIKLLLIGEGPLKKNIINKAKQMNIYDKIIFTGNRKDVENFYQIMDVFILPSLFEGLPVTGIEAQVSGLPAIFSSNVTTEVSIFNRVFFLNINSTIEWKNKIELLMNENYNRDVYIESDFNIIKLAYKMQNYYINLNNKRSSENGKK